MSYIDILIKKKIKLNFYSKNYLFKFLNKIILKLINKINYF